MRPLAAWPHASGLPRSPRRANHLDVPLLTFRHIPSPTSPCPQGGKASNDLKPASQGIVRILMYSPGSSTALKGPLRLAGPERMHGDLGLISLVESEARTIGSSRAFFPSHLLNETSNSRSLWTVSACEEPPPHPRTIRWNIATETTLKVDPNASRRSNTQTRTTYPSAPQLLAASCPR